MTLKLLFRELGTLVYCYECDDKVPQYVEVTLSTGADRRYCMPCFIKVYQMVTNDRVAAVITNDELRELRRIEDSRLVGAHRCFNGYCPSPALMRGDYVVIATQTTSPDDTVWGIAHDACAARYNYERRIPIRVG